MRQDMTARKFDLWGVPFDGGSTLGWPGSRYAPAAVREVLGWALMRVEDGRIYSLETDAVHEVSADLLTDRGDVEVVGHDIVATTAACSKAVAESVAAGRVPIVIGGDDSLLFPSVRGLHDAVEGRVGVIHFDAHLDLLDHNSFQGSLSQSSGMRRALELDRVRPADCIQVGVRHFNFPSSATFKHEVGLGHVSAAEFQALGPARAVEGILDSVGGADHLFLSFDIDAVDPAFAPGAGAHEPGGLTSSEALETIRRLAPHCDGLAITEVNPTRDHGNATSTLAAYLAFHFAVFGAAPRIP